MGREPVVPAPLQACKWAGEESIPDAANRVTGPTMRKYSSCMRGVGSAKTGMPTGKNSSQHAAPERLNVQILNLQCIFLNKNSTWFDDIAHERLEYFAGLVGMVDLNA